MRSHKAVVFTLLASMTGVCKADFYDWTLQPGEEGLWSNPLNWSNGFHATPPGAGDSAQFTNGGTCVVDQLSAIAGVKVQSGSTLKIQNQLLGTDQLHIGTFGAAGHVRQSGGLTTFSLLKFGESWGNAGGTYTLDGGGQLQIASLAYIGKRSPATFTQNSGTVTIGQDCNVGWGRSSSYLLGGGSMSCRDLTIGNGDHPAFPSSTSLFQIGDATLTTRSILIDDRDDNTGVLRIVDDGAVIHVTDYFRLWGRWEATASGTVNLDGAHLLIFTTDAEAVAGLERTTFRVTGDTQQYIEPASADLGSTPFETDPPAHNFEIGRLEIVGAGPASIINNFHNQPGGNEVVYVHELVVGPGATLDLYGRTVYAASQSIDPGATIADSVGGGQILPFTPGGCNDADIAPPFGVLDLTDVNTFVASFLANDPAADLVPDGVYDLADVIAFVDAFNAGCI
jgi:hypothetical protein